MLYTSTRNSGIHVSAAQAIAQGLSLEGGLFVPEEFPQITMEDIARYCKMSYAERAAEIMGLYLEDYTKEELTEFCQKAYCTVKFSHEDIAPVVSTKFGKHYLELWHGPTCAFKDMALQMLPYLLTAALKKTGETKQVCILVATSGDTGKAALEGFCDVPGTRILVFYPRDGVSDIQKLQMVSQKGENVSVCSVLGNFDDAQTGVKNLFSNEVLRKSLAGRGWFLSSANSINWGRLLPQIVYYISAYCDLINHGKLQLGDDIRFCVPTGNFGDILAGFYAAKMGLPVKKLICASNSNNVLTDFLTAGKYDRNRSFYTTMSPSMDILVSSNLERLLYHYTGSAAQTADYMKQLSARGEYRIAPELLKEMQQLFDCGYASEQDTMETIAVSADRGYLMDTHTAVAEAVLDAYQDDTMDRNLCVVVSTASAYKFCSSVLESLGQEPNGTGVELLEQLEKVSRTKAPAPLAALHTAVPRFDRSVEKTEMLAPVSDFLQ